ncbi:hypothetical protein MSG28_013935 [Choristoneura fumiferana]|uniref:Uncharacterized protein n=1 Tax=Choristoneura fumiferana TaxID=7141 RepID=A0ACC0K9H2_CHOFU|nr:hypothetical protein MSG28_013935 [Choristoneura fumiferana]
MQHFMSSKLFVTLCVALLATPLQKFAHADIDGAVFNSEDLITELMELRRINRALALCIAFAAEV